VEQPLRRWHRHQRADLGSTAGFAKHRHIPRIAPKGRDVLAHPLERGNQVELAHIAPGVTLVQPTQIEIAKDVQPVIDPHQHHVFALHEGIAKRGESSGASGEPAAVNIDHHGPAPLQAWRQHVQVEAVLTIPLHGQPLAIGPPAAEIVTNTIIEKEGARPLHAARAIADRIPHARPGRNGRRRHPAIVTCSRPAIGDPTEELHAAVLHTSHLPGRGLHRRRQSDRVFHPALLCVLATALQLRHRLERNRVDGIGRQ